MNNVFIVSYHFMKESSSISVGGLETYIFNLSVLLLNHGYRVSVVQPGEKRDFFTFNRISVFTFKCKKKSLLSKGILLYKDIEKFLRPDFDRDLLIFSTEALVCRNHFRFSLAIQHGISWDICRFSKSSVFSSIKTQLRSFARETLKRQQLLWIKEIICVDSNFLSWIRAQTNEVPCRYRIIYNFSSSNPDFIRFPSSSLTVVFARRFEIYRGTRVMEKAICQVNAIRNDVFFTLAGEGTDFAFLKKRLSQFQNVKFSKYACNGGADFQKDYDVSIIPTIGSEGTSLTAIEAMSSGCVVIASNVGGLNNIIINNFNGILINPNDPSGLAKAICYLADHKDELKRLSANAKNVFESSFTKEKWEQQWMEVIKQQGFSK